MFSGCVLFSHLRSRDGAPGNSLFQLLSYPRAHVCITCEISLGTSRGVNWENKTYELKRSIVSTENVNFKDAAKAFGLGENDPL